MSYRRVPVSEKKMVDYVVQTSPSMQLEGEEGRRWIDVAKVTVATGTYRKTVIERGLAQAEIVPAPGAEPLLVRALDAESARHVPVSSVQPPPQLKIGDA